MSRARTRTKKRLNVDRWSDFAHRARSARDSLAGLVAEVRRIRGVTAKPLAAVIQAHEHLGWAVVAIEAEAPPGVAKPLGGGLGQGEGLGTGLGSGGSGEAVPYDRRAWLDLGDRLYVLWDAVGALHADCRRAIGSVKARHLERAGKAIDRASLLFAELSVKQPPGGRADGPRRPGPDLSPP